MASWLGSREFQFGATALASGAVVAGAILGYQHVRRQERVEDLKGSIPALGKGHQADMVRSSFHNGRRLAGLGCAGLGSERVGMRVGRIEVE